MMPSLFLSHGAPDLLITEHEGRDMIAALGEELPTPRGIVIISPHWMTAELKVTTATALETIHDFWGFAEVLHEARYPAKSAPWLVRATREALSAAGQATREDVTRGLDHGAWTLLKLMYPDADCPVVQLSQPASATPGDLFALGAALRPLRQDGVLIIGSGGLTHNLRAMAPEGTPPQPWAVAFEDWVKARMAEGDWTAIRESRSQAPHYRTAHPTDEHYLPLHFAMGAGGAPERTTLLDGGFNYGSISLSGFRFD